jgi:hypothetical protein
MSLTGLTSNLVSASVSQEALAMESETVLELKLESMSILALESDLVSALR